MRLVFLTVIALDFLILLNGCNNQDVTKEDEDFVKELMTVKAFPLPIHSYSYYRNADDASEAWVFLIDNLGNTTEVNYLSDPYETIKFTTNELHDDKNLTVVILGRIRDSGSANNYKLLVFNGLNNKGDSVGFFVEKEDPIGDFTYQITLDEYRKYFFNSYTEEIFNGEDGYNGVTSIHDEPGFAYYSFKDYECCTTYCAILDPVFSGDKKILSMEDLVIGNETVQILSGGLGYGIEYVIHGFRNAVGYTIEDYGIPDNSESTVGYMSNVFDYLEYEYVSGNEQNWKVYGRGESIREYLEPNFNLQVVNKNSLGSFSFDANNVSYHRIVGRTKIVGSEDFLECMIYSKGTDTEYQLDVISDKLVDVLGKRVELGDITPQFLFIDDLETENEEPINTLLDYNSRNFFYSRSQNVIF